MRILDEFGYLVLRTVVPTAPSRNNRDDFKSSGRKRLKPSWKRSPIVRPLPGHYTSCEQVFGEDFFRLIHAKTVIDFGCGNGHQVIEMAKNGVGRVIGIDIQERLLSVGRDHAKQEFVADRCKFATITDELADIIVSKDAFEHFADPASVLH